MVASASMIWRHALMVTTGFLAMASDAMRRAYLSRLGAVVTNRHSLWGQGGSNGVNLIGPAQVSQWDLALGIDHDMYLQSLTGYQAQTSEFNSALTSWFIHMASALNTTFSTQFPLPPLTPIQCSPQ